MKSVKILLSLLLLVGSIAVSQAKGVVYSLRCEYQDNPNCIDIENPRLSWKIKSDEHNYTQSAYEVLVARTASQLKSQSKLLWNSGKVNSDSSIHIEYNGEKLKTGERAYWQVRVWDNNGKVSRWSEPAYWDQAVEVGSEFWDAAEWIATKSEGKVTKSLPAPYFRHTFELDKRIVSARAYITSLGTYQFYVNGEKVSDDLFAPGWTSYNNRLQYQVYDITNMLSTENAFGVIVGDGWYRGRLGWFGARALYGDRLALLLKVVVEYADGSQRVVTTDGDWKYSYGSILESDIYDGEKYDSRLEMPNWNCTDFDDGKWLDVEEVERPKDNLIATVTPLPRITKEFPAIKMFTTPSGELVADIGQNIVGWIRFNTTGESGDKLKITYAEVLDKEGNFYTENLRDAKVTDEFTLNGTADQTFEPHFTFHGFRYVKFEGVQDLSQIKNLVGVVIHSPMTQTGSFETSNALLNQFQHNIEWGQRDNFLEVPTDCPQRDERLGWTGDAQVFSMTAAYNFDVATFFTKWLGDLAIDQRADGNVPWVIPNALDKKFTGSTGWADASVIVPWTLYRVYGDTRILEKQYESMKKWVEYTKQRAGEDYLWFNKDHHFGDWLAYTSTNASYPGATTEKDLIATAYFRYSSMLLSKIATILGKADDAEYYASLSEKVKEAFANEYITRSGRMVSHTQTAYLLALSFDLVPDNLRDNAAEYLANDFMSFKHLTTGFIGTPLIGNTLSEINRDDIAFMLLMRTEYPSWLYPVTQGATTIWERWDGQHPDGSFKAAGMNSFNHYSYGAIGEWMYNHITGIKINEKSPAYKHFTLSPHVGGGLTHAKAVFESMYGEIASEWKIVDGEFIYTVTIPANTSADVVLPNAKLGEVFINSKPIVGAEQSGSDVTLSLGSGQYVFNYPY